VTEDVYVEDIAAVARHGRRHQLRVYDGVLAKSGLHARGATLRHEGPIARYQRAGQAAARSTVHGESNLRLLVTPGVLGRESLKLTDERHLLLGLSADTRIDVILDRFDASQHSEWKHIGFISRGEKAGLGMRLMVAESQGSTTTVGIHERSMLHFAEMLGNQPDDDSAARIASMVLAAKDLRADLVVTNRHQLIGTRNFPTRLGASAGICSPREALRIGCAIQRGRGVYNISEPSVVLSCTETTFYMSLANYHLPTVLTALRSALAPPLTDARRAIANCLEALLVKYQSMLMAADDIGRLTLAEGLHDSTRSDCLRLVAQVQNSLILFSSALDVVAHLVAQLGALGSANWNRITWQGLVRGDRQPFDSLNATAKALRDVADAYDDELARFTVGMRNYYQHRGSIGSSIAQYGENAKFGAYSVLDLESVAYEYSTTVPREWLGPLGDGHVQPIQVQHWLTQRLAVLLEAVIGATAWPGANWWHEKEAEEIDNEALAETRARQWWW